MELRNSSVVPLASLMPWEPRVPLGIIEAWSNGSNSRSLLSPGDRSNENRDDDERLELDMILIGEMTATWIDRVQWGVNLAVSNEEGTADQLFCICLFFPWHIRSSIVVCTFRRDRGGGDGRLMQVDSAPVGCQRCYFLSCVVMTIVYSILPSNFTCHKSSQLVLL